MPLERFRFLLGEWVREGGGQPGQASEGVSTFTAGLGDRIIVRRTRVAYPAAADRPALVHEDFMVIYKGGDGAVRAIY